MASGNKKFTPNQRQQQHRPMHQKPAGPKHMPDISRILEEFKHRSPSPQEALEVEQINLSNIRRLDPKVNIIVYVATHVALYSCTTDGDGQWKWSEVRATGCLLLYERVCFPYYGFLIMNRLDLENYCHLLTKSVEFDVSPPYVMMKDGDDIQCMWCYRESDCDALGAIFQNIGHPVQFKVESKHNRESTWGRRNSGSYAEITTGIVTPPPSISDGAKIFEMLTISAERGRKNNTPDTPFNQNGVDKSIKENFFWQTPDPKASMTPPGIVYTATEFRKATPRYAKKTRKLLNRVSDSPIVVPTPIKPLKAFEPIPCSSKSLLQLSEPSASLCLGYNTQSQSSELGFRNPTKSLQQFLDNVDPSPSMPVVQTEEQTTSTVKMEEAKPVEKITMSMQTIEQLEKAAYKPSGTYKLTDYQLIEIALKQKLGIPLLCPGLTNGSSGSRKAHSSGSSGDNNNTPTSGCSSPHTRLLGSQCISFERRDLKGSRDPRDNPVLNAYRAEAFRNGKTEVEPEWVRTPDFKSPNQLYQTIYPPDSNVVRTSFAIQKSSGKITPHVLLTKEQLLVSLVHLLKFDLDFGNRVYDSYVASATKTNSH